MSPANLTSLPSIVTGQGGTTDLSTKSSAESAARLESSFYSGAFNVGSSQNSNTVLFVIAGVIALAIIFKDKLFKK